MTMQQVHAALWFVRITAMSTERKIVPACVLSTVRAVLAGVLCGRPDTNACADVCKLFRGDIGKLAGTALLGIKTPGIFGCLQWDCQSKQGEEEGEEGETLMLCAENAGKHAYRHKTDCTAGLPIRKQLSDEAMAMLCMTLKL